MSARYFRTEPLREAPQRVDRANGVIYGYAVATVGEAKGHNRMLDVRTLEQIVEFGNAAPNGHKGRFTHPGLSSDGMGKYLGRSKNFRLDTTGERPKARADFHFSELADKSPHGKLGAYVLDLAELEPDSFGSSMVIEEGAVEPQLDAEGNPLKNENGKPLSPLLRLKKLKAVDMVDEPAANEGLFDAPIDFDSLPDAQVRQAWGILDRLFSGREPQEIRQRVDSFLNRYLSQKGFAMSEHTPTPPQDTPPATPPAAPQQFSQADLDQARHDAEKAAAAKATARAEQITSLCATSGYSQLAAELIANTALSVEDVRGKLFAAMCKDRQPVGDGGGADGPAQPDPDKQFKDEYAAHQALYSAKGISEADFVLSRKIDEGLAPVIQPKKPAA